MNKIQLFLVSLVLPIFMGYAVGCKPLCKNKDGFLDITFGDHGTVITDLGGTGDTAQGVVVLPCGRIVAAGRTNLPSASGFYDFALAGYTSYGVLDPHFGPDGTGIVLTDFATVLGVRAPSNDFAFAATLQKNCNGCDFVCGTDCGTDCNRNCKIVVVGGSSALSGGGLPQFAIARYNCDGTLDTTFGVDGSGVVVVPIQNVSIAYAVAIQEDNKIVVAGFTYAGGDNIDFAVVRLNCDGTLDTTFGCDKSGIVITDFGSGDDEAFAVKIQKDGKIVVAGESAKNNGNGYSFALARYLPNGRLDRSFGPDHNGKVITDFSGMGTSDDVANALVLLENCDLECSCDDSLRIVAIGSSNSSSLDGSTDFALAAYTDKGFLDRRFGLAGTGLVTTDFAGTANVNDIAYAAVVERDCGNKCKIVVVGTSNASLRASSPKFALARYDANGILDIKDFGIDGKMTTVIGDMSEAYAVALQEDGDIVAAGFTFSPDRREDFALARYDVCKSCECLSAKKPCLAC